MPRRTPLRLNRSSSVIGLVLLGLVSAVGCSPVDPAGQDGGSEGGGGSGQDVVGEPADAAKVRKGGTLTVALSSRG